MGAAARASAAWWRSCSPNLIVLPLLDIYRRYYGWRMAFYMGAVFYAAMAAAALIVDLGFTALGLVPHPTSGIEARVSHFEINYTFWLNLAALALAIWLFVLNRRHPMDHGHVDGAAPAVR